MITRLLTTVRHQVAALVAVTALLTQVAVPHVHDRHAPADALASAAELARCGAECPTALRSASQRADDADTHRDSASCPLCRAQSDARSSLLPVAITLPLPTAAVARDGRTAVASISVDVRSLAAPRAPPAIS
jgi:hypothetical protein